ERARAHQRVGDLERLLAVVGMRDEEVLGLDAELARVAHVERVLRVDEGADAAALLALGDELERERGLTRRLRSVDLDHPPARDPADAERDIEAERARRQAGDVLRQRLLAELHDRALAELLLDLADGEVDRPLPVHIDAHVAPSPPDRRAALEWAHSTLPGRESPAADTAFFQTSASEREARQWLVDRSARLEVAPVEHYFLCSPGAEVGVRPRRD